MAEIKPFKQAYNQAALEYGAEMMEIAHNQALYKAALKRSQDLVFDQANAFIDAMIAIHRGEVHTFNGTNQPIPLQHMLDCIAFNQFEGHAPAGSSKKEFGPAKKSRAAALRLLDDPENMDRRRELLGYMVYEVHKPFEIFTKDDALATVKENDAIEESLMPPNVFSLAKFRAPSTKGAALPPSSPSTPPFALAL